jgi:hypothetical protein
VASFKLNGLKTARVAWITFLKFEDGTLPLEPQVITLTAGAPGKWAGPESCTYQLKLVPTPPAITIGKGGSACALRRGETAVFQVLAM